MAGMLLLKILELEDMPAYRALRVRAVTENPTAFAETPAETPDAATYGEIMQANAPYIVPFGAFEGGELVGIVVLMGNPRQKLRHRAEVVAMYVAPEGRGRGIGKALLTMLLHHARAELGLDLLTLAVTVGNDSARRLYQSLGFEPWAYDAHYFKVEGVYHDVEWMRLELKD